MLCHCQQKMKFRKRSENVAPFRSRLRSGDGADIVDESQPFSLPLKDFDADAQEEDGDVHFVGFQEAHSIFLRGDDKVNGAVGATLHKSIHL